MTEKSLSLMAPVAVALRGTRPSFRGASARTFGTVQKGVAFNRITPRINCTLQRICSIRTVHLAFRARKLAGFRDAIAGGLAQNVEELK